MSPDNGIIPVPKIEPCIFPDIDGITHNAYLCRLERERAAYKDAYEKLYRENLELRAKVDAVAIAIGFNRSQPH